MRVLAALTSISLLVEAQSTDTSDTMRGRALLEANCASCHAIRREGESPMRTAPPLRDLHKRYPVEHLAEALAEGLTTGHPAMPEYKFEAKQVDAIIDYLKSLER